MRTLDHPRTPLVAACVLGGIGLVAAPFAWPTAIILWLMALLMAVGPWLRSKLQPPRDPPNATAYRHADGEIVADDWPFPMVKPSPPAMKFLGCTDVNINRFVSMGQGLLEAANTKRLTVNDSQAFAASPPNGWRSTKKSTKRRK